MLDKKLPSEWERITGIMVMDPDGWDRTKPDDWFTPITEAEFNSKAAASTCRSTDQQTFL